MSVATMAGSQAAAHASQMAVVLQSNIIRFFRQRNALEPKNAIVVEEIDWIEMGFTQFTGNIIWGTKDKVYRAYGLNQLDDGRFWLNIDEMVNNIKKIQKLQRKWLIWLLIGLLLFIALIPFLVSL